MRRVECGAYWGEVTNRKKLCGSQSGEKREGNSERAEQKSLQKSGIHIQNRGNESERSIGKSWQKIGKRWQKNLARARREKRED